MTPLPIDIVVQVAGTPEWDLSAENEALRLGPAAP